MSDIDLNDVRKLDGRLLLVFSALLRRRSVTAAAAELHLSQSAVSHALARLRRLHDDPLFTRRPHGLAPTKRAEELGPSIDRLIELAGDLYGTGSSRWDPATATRRFDVAVPEFVIASIGTALLTRWQTAAPGVSLSTAQVGHGAAIDALVRGDLDLAVGRFRARQPAALVRELLYSDSYCVVAAADHPDIAGDLTPDQYRSLGHVIAGSASEGDEHERVPADLRVSAVVPGWTTALAMVASGRSIATCPRRLAEHHAEGLGLQVLDLPGSTVEIEVSLVRRAAQPTPAVAWLIEEVRAVAASD